MSFFKNKNLFFFSVFLSISLISCSEFSELLHLKKKNKRVLKKIKITKKLDQFYVPKFLINLVSNKYIDYIKTNYPKVNLQDAELSIGVPRSPLKLKVFLTEKKQGALKNDSIFYLSEGVGVIDLARYATGKKGSFYIQFEFYKKSKNKKNIDILDHFLLFYSSQTKKTSFGGSSLGTQCGTFLDLTSFGKKILTKKGILVQVQGENDSHPIQFIGGIFYFIYFKGKHLHIGAVQFKDSRFPNLQCE